MPKRGLDKTTCNGCIRGTAPGGGWVLCIGAGASHPIFPSWSNLVSRLLDWSNPKLSEKGISELKQSLSLESLIQAAFIKNGLEPYQSAQVLSRLLYADLKRTLNVDEWKLFRLLFNKLGVGSLSLREAENLLSCFTEHYPASTVLQLAEVLARSLEKKLAPSHIISLNAEPLLLMLINAYVTVNTQLPVRKIFDVSLRGISYKRTDRIPFHFCHGLLPLAGEKPLRASASLDKLIFSETEYLGLAGSMFSWQSAVFLNAAMTNTMVFVGLSFSDPNIRRWLGFVHNNRMDELRSVGAKTDISTRHYWIRTRPQSKEQEEWIEAAVAHLGIRVVWIEEWKQVGACIHRMLSV
jgi:hypothetical protein